MLYHFFYPYRNGHCLCGPFCKKEYAEQVLKGYKEESIKLGYHDEYKIVCERRLHYVGNQERKLNHETV